VHADRYQRARLAPGHPRQSHAHRRHAHPLAHGRQPPRSWCSHPLL